jgi:hypothetical protein
MEWSWTTERFLFTEYIKGLYANYVTLKKWIFGFKVSGVYPEIFLKKLFWGRSQITSRFRGEGGSSNLWQSKTKNVSLENLWQGGEGVKKVYF